jgi:hypothetical protein
MDHYCTTKATWDDGIRALFKQAVGNETDANTAVAALRKQVDKFCSLPAPKDFDELRSLSRQHTLIVGAISHVGGLLNTAKINEMLAAKMAAKTKRQ